jgi:hypothetical protein
MFLVTSNNSATSGFTLDSDFLKNSVGLRESK